MASDNELKRLTTRAAAGRVVIGLAPLLAPGPTSRLLGFPRTHDNPSARLMGRLFAVRDIALGVLTWQVRNDPVLLRHAFRINAAIDASDMTVAALPPLLGRRGIDRAAFSTAAFAFGGANVWLTLLRRSKTSANG
ncbi:MAG TPA: DUF4267 domain-containing protein [Conexibacter sp.]|nr:DUF4267 domain-containing protein [Conexibacter sp.]